ncbi:hypothetical protein ABTX62_19480 [Streptomyces sp. NPDC096046]|uniref:hypothetical protein n=1 Tax=Streptomyces sp. NPDC096046 TaxID=3155542 RepID=UPI00331BD965
MSETVLYLIPSDPYWQPDQAASSSAVALAEELCPDALGDIEADQGDAPAFINGAGLESVSCPRCGAQLDFHGWWMARMDEAYRDSKVPSLAVKVPCCGADTTLNDLVYNVPSGFARFRLRAWSPNRHMLNGEDLTRIGHALGHPVRQIWSLI